MSLRLLHLQNETNASCPDLKGQNYRASFNTHASSRGQRKKIYHGHLDGKGPRKGEHAVVKVFRDASGTEEMCDTEIAKHKLARKLARKFNKLVPDDHYKIDFTVPLKSTVERLGVGCYLSRHKSRQMDKKEWVLIEENLLKKLRHVIKAGPVHTSSDKFFNTSQDILLSMNSRKSLQLSKTIDSSQKFYLGEYRSFIRKTGLKNGKDPSTLDSFLHFTYHESDGKYVLCGFQGVLTDEGYLLTTPCIHSVDFSFGSATDKGPKYIRRVFKHHQCNNLCYSFKMPEPCLDGDENEVYSEEEVDAKSVDSDNTNGKKYEQDLVGHGDNVVLENGNFLNGEGAEKTVEATNGEITMRQGSVKRKGSVKTKDHRSNVVALGSLKKQPSF